MKIKGIIFDLDQTLIDSRDAHYAALLEALNKYGIFPKKLKWIYGKTAEEITKYNFPKINEKEIKKIVTLKKKLLKKYIDLIKVLPKAREVLKFFKKKKIKLALVTNNSKDEIKSILSETNLNFFDTIIGKEYGYKPNPELVKIALKNMKLKKNEVLYVGDANADIETAKPAGIKIAIITICHKAKKRKDADFVLKNLEDLKRLIA